jgi:hypothetical protein
MEPANYDFDALKAASFGAGATWLTTFAYWLGVLSDPASKIARDGKEVGSVMSSQFELEEQACDLAICVPTPTSSLPSFNHWHR